MKSPAALSLLPLAQAPGCAGAVAVEMLGIELWVLPIGILAGGMSPGVAEDARAPSEPTWLHAKDGRTLYKENKK